LNIIKEKDGQKKPAKKKTDYCEHASV